MNVKLVSVIAVAVLFAAGIGYVIGNPESVAALSDDLTGAVTTSDRTATVVGVGIEIADTPIAGVQSIAGCGTVFPTATYSGTEKYTTYSASTRSYQPCTIVIDGTVPAPVSAWLSDLQNGNSQHRDVEVAYRDAYGKTIGGFRIKNGLLTGFSVSTLDASTSEKMRITLTVLPEVVERTLVDVASAASSKSYATSNFFTLQLSGATDANVVRVQNLSVTFPAVSTTTGDQLYATWRAGTPVFGNITITARDAGPKSPYSSWETEVASGRSSMRDVVVQTKASDGVTVLNTFKLPSSRLVGFGWGLQGSMVVESAEIRPTQLVVE